MIDLTTIQKTTRAKSSDIAKAKNKIVPVTSLGQDPLTICVYGRNKQGKTRFACSSDLKTLLIDCQEKGFASVRKYKNVDIFRLTKWEELDWVYWYLRSGEHDYKVVVIDTVTMLAVIGMKYVLKDDFERDMTRDPMTPDKRSWGKLGEYMKDAIIKFRNLASHPTKPMHVVFLAQEKTTTSEDDDGGTVSEVHPELSPAPRSTLLSAVGIIGRIYTREVVKEVNGKEKKIMQHRMLLGAHPKYVSGNRFEELKYVEINPTLGGFIKKIHGETNADAR